MFICQKCQRQTLAGEPAHTVIVEAHRHVHPFRVYTLRVMRRLIRCQDPGGIGDQIVRELRVCAQCAVAESLADG